MCVCVWCVCLLCVCVSLDAHLLNIHLMITALSVLQLGFKGRGVHFLHDSRALFARYYGNEGNMCHVMYQDML